MSEKHSSWKENYMEQYREVCIYTRSLPNYTYIFIDFVCGIGLYVKGLPKTKQRKSVSFVRCIREMTLNLLDKNGMSTLALVGVYYSHCIHMLSVFRLSNVKSCLRKKKENRGSL